MLPSKYTREQQTAMVVKTMDKIIEELIYSYHIKKIDDHNFTVIANYFESLEQIATKYNLQLVEKGNSASNLTVWGHFKMA